MTESMRERERKRCISQSQENNEFGYLEDGFVYWFSPENRGCYASHHLRWLADELDSRNEEQAAQIDRYFTEQESERP